MKVHSFAVAAAAATLTLPSSSSQKYEVHVRQLGSTCSWLGCTAKKQISWDVYDLSVGESNDINTATLIAVDTNANTAVVRTDYPGLWTPATMDHTVQMGGFSSEERTRLASFSFNVFMFETVSVFALKPPPKPTCKRATQGCSGTSACCPGLKCLKKKCCKRAAQGCSRSSQCCAALKCVNKKCLKCRKATQGCSKTSPCCAGLKCTNGKCLRTRAACKNAGERCLIRKQCCQTKDTKMKCFKKRCRVCRKNRKPCKMGIQCCSGRCLKKRCQ